MEKYCGQGKGVRKLEQMKKLARKLRNSEDDKLSLPIHDEDSRPLDSQGFPIPLLTPSDLKFQNLSEAMFPPLFWITEKFEIFHFVSQF